MNSDAPPEVLFRQAVWLFNSGKFFEAHEVWESLWMTRRSGADGPFLQALIQIAAGFHRVAGRAPRPAERLFQAALKKLEPYGSEHRGVRLEPIRLRVAEEITHLEKRHAAAERSLPPEVTIANEEQLAGI